MSWLTFIVIGLLVGAVAKVLLPGRDPGGWIVTILIGIAGSMLAGYLAPLVGWHPKGTLMTFGTNVAGAMLLLLAYRLAARGS